MKNSRCPDYDDRDIDALGEIEIRVEGRVGTEPIAPKLVDIDEIREILVQANHLFFPGVHRSQLKQLSTFRPYLQKRRITKPLEN